MTSVRHTLAGRYRLESQIATGGMAAVWRARDELLDRPVAIKILSEELSHDARAAERFRREARTAASMSHPNMANVFDLVEEDGRPGIVMEYVESETLGSRMARMRRMPIADSIWIMGHTLDALEAAHQCDVVHRDVKPGNILLTGDRGVKVADFGIARSLGEASLTQTGTIMGTAAYAAPEQVRGQPAIPQSDIYSAGVVLYEMLTGVRPFTGDSPASVALARLSTDPVPPSAHRASIPPALDAVVMKALARDPGDRFGSAAEMHAALARADDATQVLRVTASDETMALGVSAAGALAAARTSDAATPAGGFAEPVRRRLETVVPPPIRRRLAAVLLPLLLVAAIAIAAAAITSGRPSKAAASPSPSRSVAPACCVVPRMIGLPLDIAIERLRAAGLRLGDAILKESTEPNGVIISQSVPAGRRLSRGETVDLTWSKHVEPATTAPAPAGKKKHKGHGD